MKINDKVLAASLVALGIFSTVSATNYVGSLTVDQKKSLSVICKNDSGKIRLCQLGDPSNFPQDADNPGHKRKE